MAAKKKPQPPLINTDTLEERIWESGDARALALLHLSFTLSRSVDRVGELVAGGNYGGSFGEAAVMLSRSLETIASALSDRQE